MTGRASGEVRRRYVDCWDVEGKCEGVQSGHRTRSVCLDIYRGVAPGREDRVVGATGQRPTPLATSITAIWGSTALHWGKPLNVFTVVVGRP